MGCWNDRDDFHVVCALFFETCVLLVCTDQARCSYVGMAVAGGVVSSCLLLLLVGCPRLGARLHADVSPSHSRVGPRYITQRNALEE